MTGAVELPVATQISNLLHRYADQIDAGDFAGAAELFSRGSLIAGGRRIEGTEAIVAMWRGIVRLYEDGTPRTRHIMTNPIINLSPDGEEAGCLSQWTVLQAACGQDLQVIGTGRYRDRFRRAEGEWHFISREYVGIDLAGDLSAHMLTALDREEA